MPVMGGGDLQDQLRQGRNAQPVRHLVTQDTAPYRDRAALVPVLPLAGNHQHQPLALGGAAHDETVQRRMRAVHGHAVQVDPGLGLELAAFQAIIGLPVHLDRGRRDLFRALASVPVLGVFFYNVMRKRGRDERRKQQIFDELGVSAEAPAIIPAAITKKPHQSVASPK